MTRSVGRSVGLSNFKLHFPCSYKFARARVLCVCVSVMIIICACVIPISLFCLSCVGFVFCVNRCISISICVWLSESVCSFFLFLFYPCLHFNFAISKIYLIYVCIPFKWIFRNALQPPCVYVCVCVWLNGREREIENVCVCLLEREKECVCLWVYVCMIVCLPAKVSGRKPSVCFTPPN